MINVDELRRMSPDERTELARVLATLDAAPPDDLAAAGESIPRTGADLPGTPRRRIIALALILGCCVVLAVWIGVLAVTLPRYYRSGGWRGAWVGFDAMELAAFAATAWAAWKHRQLVIACLLVVATLLCCDAWFDVTLDLRTSGFWVSLLMALCVELPLAGLAIIGARRLMRMNVRAATRTGRVPPLWKIPLYGLETRGFRTLIPAEPCPPAPLAEPGEASRSPGPVLSARGAPE